MSLKDLKNKPSKSEQMINMSCRTTKAFRDEVTKFCDKHQISVADFMRYSMRKVMEDEK
jgi:hypothetical protein